MEITNIALIGEERRRIEFSQRLPDLSLVYEGNGTPSYEIADSCNLFIDLDLDENPQRLPFYFKQDKILVGSAVKKSLRQQRKAFVGQVKAAFIGLNTLPSFIDRPIWEVAATDENGKKLWKQLSESLNLELEFVEDRVGMVTPRILFPIINEAFIMWQEGTAQPGDIDVAMKLGTNYPKGPIAWANEIGLKHVVEVLELLYQDLGSSRFVPCRLLKEKAIEGEE